MTDNLVFQPQAGRLELSGQLDFDTVPGLIERIRRQWRQAADAGVLHVDLTAVEHSNSAGIALLLEIRRLCRQGGRTMRVTGLPDQMQTIMQVYGVQAMFQSSGAE